MKAEEYIEEAIQDIMQARTYVSTNSVPVVRFRDRLTSKGDHFITVHASPVNRLSNNHNLYSTRLRLIADTKSQEDLKSKVLDELIEQCNDEIQETLSEATLQSAINNISATTGITINGVVQAEGSDTDGDYQMITAEVDIFLTYIKP